MKTIAILLTLFFFSYESLAQEPSRGTIKIIPGITTTVDDKNIATSDQEFVVASLNSFHPEYQNIYIGHARKWWPFKITNLSVYHSSENNNERSAIVVSGTFDSGKQSKSYTIQFEDYNRFKDALNSLKSKGNRKTTIGDGYVRQTLLGEY